jgi:hypothetical protein
VTNWQLGLAPLQISKSEHDFEQAEQNADLKFTEAAQLSTSGRTIEAACVQETAQAWQDHLQSRRRDLEDLKQRYDILREILPHLHWQLHAKLTQLSSNERDINSNEWKHVVKHQMWRLHEQIASASVEGANRVLHDLRKQDESKQDEVNEMASTYQQLQQTGECSQANRALSVLKPLQAELQILKDKTALAQETANTAQQVVSAARGQLLQLEKEFSMQDSLLYIQTKSDQVHALLADVDVDVNVGQQLRASAERAIANHCKRGKRLKNQMLALETEIAKAEATGNDTVCDQIRQRLVVLQERAAENTAHMEALGIDMNQYEIQARHRAEQCAALERQEHLLQEELLYLQQVTSNCRLAIHFTVYLGRRFVSMVSQ